VVVEITWLQIRGVMGIQRENLYAYDLMRTSYVPVVIQVKVSHRVPIPPVICNHVVYIITHRYLSERHSCTHCDFGMFATVFLPVVAYPFDFLKSNLCMTAYGFVPLYVFSFVRKFFGNDS